MTQISIIVPMYKVEKYITNCLKSIQCQTFTDFECLCIDDGSPDNSGALAEAFAATDKRFRVIHTENDGLSVARNLGVQQTTAPYVMFLDSDDYIHPQMVSFLFTALQKYKTPVVACTLQHTTELYQPIEPTETFDALPITVFDDPLRAFCQKKIKTSVLPRLYERTFLEQIPFIKGIYFEDVPFTTVCLHKLKSLPVLQAPMYYYYRKSDSIMRSPFSTQKIDSYVTLIRHLHTYFTQNAPDKLPMVQADILNQRIKTMLNQIIRKQSDKTKQETLLSYAKQPLRALYEERIISFQKLKWKHRLALMALLRCSPKRAHRICRLAMMLP